MPDGKSPKPRSGPTITAADRASRGQTQVSIRLTVAQRAELEGAIEALRIGGETNGAVILRVVTRALKLAGKKVK